MTRYQKIRIEFLVNPKYSEDEATYQIKSFIDGSDYIAGYSNEVFCGEVEPYEASMFGIPEEEDDNRE